MENWKDIAGYEGLYQISDRGNIASLPKQKVYNRGKYKNRIDQRPFLLMKPVVNADGYIYIGLYKNNKCARYRVHRLVASAFIPNPQNRPEVNHKDYNRANNSADNLEWVTRSEQMQHAVKKEGRRTAKPWLGKGGALFPGSKPVGVLGEAGEIITNYPSATIAAEAIGSTQANVSAVCRGERNFAMGKRLIYLPKT